MLKSRLVIFAAKTGGYPAICVLGGLGVLNWAVHKIASVIEGEGKSQKDLLVEDILEFNRVNGDAFSTDGQIDYDLLLQSYLAYDDRVVRQQRRKRSKKKHVKKARKSKR